jgi:murein DD-endopeptidase MepM/ murein hydrolase activator NlpD
VTQYIDFRRFPVTCRYGVPRASGPHQGQDHGCPRGTPLYAPEAGHVQYAVIRQHGDFNPDLSWQDGTWWPYSRYYEHWAGGLAIVYGERYTHVFMHLDPRWIYSACDKSFVVLSHTKVRKPGDYTSYVIAEVLWQPTVCGEGDVVAASGVSGFDDAPHVHYQLMKAGRNEHTVLDPSTVWG